MIIHSCVRKKEYITTHFLSQLVLLLFDKFSYMCQLAFPLSIHLKEAYFVTETQIIEQAILQGGEGVSVIVKRSQHMLSLMVVVTI